MKKFKMEYLLYIFIILSPILDASSFLFHQFYPESRFSPTTFIRPLIPIILLAYIFFTDKKSRKFLAISAFIFIGYAFIHLLIAKNLFMEVSYGSIFGEIQYLVNYTYMAYLLYIFWYFSKKGDLKHLKKALLFMLIGYLAFLYIPLLTKTSSSTYIEGIGYKGWFTSGNSISTILVLLLATLTPSILKDRKWYTIIPFLLTGFYLVFLIGTRTGMFGFVLVVILYLIGTIGIKIIQSKKISKRKLILGFLFLVLFGEIILWMGSSTLQRRKMIAEEAAKLVDVNTGKFGHTTVSVSIMVQKIRNHYTTPGFITDEQAKAYLDLYCAANKYNIRANNNRIQQLLFNIFLVKEQKNPIYMLFGNGHLVNAGEMILEMEIPSILLNFGLIGFCLYLLPFFIQFFKKGKSAIKNISKLTIDHFMYFSFLALAFFLSFFAGYVFFSSSCVLIIICLLTLIREEQQ